MRICSDFEGYTQVNAWNGEREFTAKLTKKGNLLTGNRACTAAPKAVESQNRKKKYILAEGTVIPPLADMGVMTSNGAVHKAMYDKFKQINRFWKLSIRKTSYKDKMAVHPNLQQSNQKAVLLSQALMTCQYVFQNVVVLCRAMRS